MIQRTALLVFCMMVLASILEAVAFEKVTVREAADRNAVCNDGSPAVYYFRKGAGSGSRTWVIFLAGGGFCYSTQSCRQRAANMPELMTSLDKPATLKLHGILSDSQEVNPDFYNANQVVLPYCSSDLWSGDRPASSESAGYEFRGWRIFRSVVLDLINRNLAPRLSTANKVLLSGTSAGGIGVMVHLDWLAKKLPDTDVRGLNDAGWFPEFRLPFIPGYDHYINEAVRFWNGKPDSSCGRANPDAKYKCYLTSAFPYLQKPMLIQMSQYDSVALGAVGIDYPFSLSELAIAELFAFAIRDSLSGIPAAFSPRTFTHGVLPYRRFRNLEVQDSSLRDVTGNWFFDRSGPVKLIQ